MSDHPAPSNPEVKYETSDANATALLKFILWTAAGTVGIVYLLFGLYFVFVRQEAARQPPPPVMQMDAATSSPPPPLLQAEPTLDYGRFRAEEDAVLSSYGWVDKDAGRVRIPIEEALRLAAERGLPRFTPEGVR
jgi:hypothetical protein